MNREGALGLARAGRLYPAVILHGGGDELRRETALELGKSLLCEARESERPCGACRHCRRVAWPGGAGESFHPDFMVLERDLATVTSVDATKSFLRTAHSAPFEARGQVFVIASAESLSGSAANALLKILEEPHDRSPRNFLLLAPSRLDLLPTLRSRSLAVFLGNPAPPDPEEVERLARGFADSVRRFLDSNAAVHLMAAAAALEEAGGWSDPRAEAPWALAAAAVVRAAERSPDRIPRGPALALAAALLEAPVMRVRRISPRRILEGLVFRHLGLAVGSGAPASSRRRSTLERQERS